MMIRIIRYPPMMSIPSSWTVTFMIIMTIASMIMIIMTISSMTMIIMAITWMNVLKHYFNYRIVYLRDHRGDPCTRSASPAPSSPQSWASSLEYSDNASWEPPNTSPEALTLGSWSEHSHSESWVHENISRKKVFLSILTNDFFQPSLELAVVHYDIFALASCCRLFWDEMKVSSWQHRGKFS